MTSSLSSLINCDEEYKHKRVFFCMQSDFLFLSYIFTTLDKQPLYTRLPRALTHTHSN